jgi:YHS domain-containing protein
MGKVVVFTYEGQEIKVCCRECKNAFQDNPTEGMKKFHAAVAEAAGKN